MGKGRSPRRKLGKGARAGLLAGITLAAGGIFLPWISIDSAAPLPVVGSLLSGLGMVPAEEPVAGWQIPWIAWHATDDPFLRTSLALAELVSARPDRAAARALFGDRFEERYAILTFAPSVLALLHLVLLRRGSPPALRKGFAVLDAAAILAGLWAIALIPGPSSTVALEVRFGIPVSLLGLGLLGIACAR